MRLAATAPESAGVFDGQPFFVVTAPVNPGLVAGLRTQIVPRLLAEVPGQPTAATLAADRYVVRFTLVCGREGYSPGLFAELAAQRIAILSYHKFPDADWPADEHRVSVSSTDWRADLRILAPRLMARWCQENFLKSLREHYGLDRLIAYGAYSGSFTGSSRGTRI